jgi:ribosomal protein S18 acetylase RimI-like enzyme
VSKEIMIGGVNLFDVLKDIGFEEVEDDTNNDFIPPFLVREDVEWSHIQKLSCDELKAHLIEKHIIEKESIIYSTLINKDKEFIILYGYEYDPFYIVATIIGSDNSYNHVSLAAMERQDGSVNILNINVRDNDANNGYGSILMKQLLKVAISNDIGVVRGEIVPQDYATHKDRLFHFYKKHDFNIEDFGHFATIKWENPNKRLEENLQMKNGIVGNLEFSNEQLEKLAGIREQIDNVQSEFSEDSKEWESLNTVWCQIDRIINGEEV